MLQVALLTLPLGHRLFSHTLVCLCDRTAHSFCDVWLGEGIEHLRHVAHNFLGDKPRDMCRPVRTCTYGRSPPTTRSYPCASA